MPPLCSFFFFFNDTATTEIYTLSLHDALPIFRGSWGVGPNNNRPGARRKKLEYSWWARPAKSHLLTSSPPQAARIPTASRFVLPRWLRWVPPTIAATTNFRLHFKCLDNRGFGYILRDRKSVV